MRENENHRETLKRLRTGFFFFKKKKIMGRAGYIVFGLNGLQ